MAGRGAVCVLGLGLIGGSILRRITAGPEATGPGRVEPGPAAFGWNRSAATVTAARAAGCDADTDLPRVLRRAATTDALLVVAVPMPAVDGVLAAIAQHAPGCAVTDVVSVKAPVAEAVRRHGLERRWCGGHPMAGTAHSGWEATDPMLFEGAVWVVGTETECDAAVRARVEALATDCGSRIVSAGAADHDAAVARISHLPHLLAEALSIVGDEGGPLARELAAGSFRSGTRVAATAPGLVRAMCEANREALLGALDRAVELLQDARAELAAEGTVARLVDAGYAATAAEDDAR